MVNFKKLEPRKDSLATSEAEARVRSYLSKEKRLAEYSVDNTTRCISQLMRQYGTTEASKDLAYKIEDDLKAKGRKPNTVRLYLYALSLWYEALNDGKKLDIKMPKKTEPGKRDKRLLPHEVYMLLQTSKNSRDKALIGILAYAGLRRKEVANLDVEDISLKDGIICIRDNKEPDVQYGGVKNGKEAEVVIPKQLSPILKAYLDEFLPQRPQTTRALFTSEKNMRLTLDSIGNIVSDTGKKAGIKRKDPVTGKDLALPVYPHLLRHTAASTMANSGIPLQFVQGQLRHSDIRMTLAYVHHSNEDVKKAMDKYFFY